MIKQLGMTLGLALLLLAGSLKADCDALDKPFEEFQLVCGMTPQDLSRDVNALRATNKYWHLLGPVHIEKDGGGFLYCQTLYRYL